jgi:hypothetical protein
MLVQRGVVFVEDVARDFNAGLQKDLVNFRGNMTSSTGTLNQVDFEVASIWHFLLPVTMTRRSLLTG